MTPSNRPHLSASRREDREVWVCNGCTPPCICACRDRTEFGCDGAVGECRKLPPAQAAKILDALSAAQRRRC